MAPKNQPPDRWMDYSPMGDRMVGTRFICMKVPLKECLTKQISEGDKFTCDMALDIALERGHKIGLVIDLSFTKRYYNPDDFEHRGVIHKKIFMPGRIIPSKSIIEEFSDIVTKFEEENQDNEMLIAVHCTHGLNRTGYMICRYLIDKKKFKPKVAIEAFNLARGHNIERAVYLNDLLKDPMAVSPRKRECHKNFHPQDSDPLHWQHQDWYGEVNYDRHSRGWSTHYGQPYSYQPYPHSHTSHSHLRQYPYEQQHWTSNDVWYPHQNLVPNFVPYPYPNQYRDYEYDHVNTTHVYSPKMKGRVWGRNNGFHKQTPRR